MMWTTTIGGRELLAIVLLIEMFLAYRFYFHEQQSISAWRIITSTTAIPFTNGTTFDDPVDDGLPPCRVVVLNKPDWHYELLESAVLRFPLPWKELTAGSHTRNKCSTSKPVDFEISVKNGHGLTNESTGWIDYFKSSLEGTVRERSDGVQARFAGLADSSSFRDKNNYTAMIRVSVCPKNYIIGNPHHFCIQHISCKVAKECKDDTPENTEFQSRSAWLNPMHPRYFIASDFPQFPTPDCHPKDEKINLCVSGNKRHHVLLAKALQILQPKEDELQITIHQRQWGVPDALNASIYPKEYVETNLTRYISMVSATHFVEFQRSISRCDALLPLIDPERNAGYFPHHGAGKLSGCLSQAIGYKLPTVIHQDLYNVYRDYLAEPALPYNSTDATFIAALDELIRILKSQKEKKMCRSSS